ncbi:MAG: histidinol-phosphate aminotransferase [Betaproteobacteria bacterium SG8_40]|jgi:histidinol-phosphate aminotransferase|nr:MAG: histidinol-phosphate aminotransferase [Betaproteobacteria bacterium SG8_40]
MSRFWSDVVSRLTPYVPGEQTERQDVVKLNTNENPYGPSPRVLEALRENIGDGLRLYPDPVSARLREVISRRFGVTPAQVFVGNGSDEVLAHTFRALLTHPAPVLFPDVTYSFYPVYCRLFGASYKHIALNARFEIDVGDYLQDNGGIVFPNPNAPTGLALGVPQIERLLEANTESVVVIDEAYVDFGCESVVPLVHRYPHLLVTHTLSKSYALAGLRVGFAIGHPDLIGGLERVKDSFNSYPVDRLAQAAAIAAIEDVGYLAASCRKIVESRERMAVDMSAIGFEVLPSKANFLLARHPSHEAETLSAKLRERGVIVRHFRNPQRVAPYLRISVGTDAQCAALLAALRDVLG